MSGHLNKGKRVKEEWKEVAEAPRLSFQALLQFARIGTRQAADIQALNECQLSDLWGHLHEM